MKLSKNQIFTAGSIAALAMLLFYIYRKMKGSTITAAAADKNVKAFLAMIRHGEGTTGPNGYRTLFGGKLFDSYSKHPNICVPYKTTCSTAAGAYQFLNKTWNMIRTRVAGLDDFSPDNQDKAAIYLLDYRGVLDDVKAGNFERAINGWSKSTGANKEWASLPNSPYGQPMVTMAKAKDLYKNAGGTLA